MCNHFIKINRDLKLHRYDPKTDKYIPFMVNKYSILKVVSLKMDPTYFYVVLPGQYDGRKRKEHDKYLAHMYPDEYDILGKFKLKEISLMEELYGS